MDLATHFEERDLPERQKAALRLAQAFLERPSALTLEARAAALKHYTPEELVGLLLKLTSFIVNKPRPALGIDRPLDPRQTTYVDYELARQMRAQA